MGPEEHIEQDDRLTSNMSRGMLHKNGLRTTVKGRLSEWPKKANPTVYWLQKKWTIKVRTEEKDRKMHAIVTPIKRKFGVTILISDRVDFRANSIIKDQEGYFIIVKVSIPQEEATILNT